MNKRTVRVLYSFPGRVGQSGIGSTALHQMEGIGEAGCDLVTVGGSYDEIPRHASKNLTTMTAAGFRVPHRFFGSRERAVRIHDWRTSRALKRLRNEIDVVHCWPMGSLRTLRTARELGVKTFLERPNTHTGYAYEAVSRECEKLGLTTHRGHSHAFDASRLAREEEEYETADFLLAPSEFVRNTFLDRGVPSEKVVLHQYGCDPDRFSPPAGPEERPTDLPLTAVFVGRCEPRKGLHYALQAWIESGVAERGQFVICGSFVQGYREVLHKWLSHPSVKVCGFLPDVAETMRQSDILLLPSIEEGSALVTYEARSCGCVLVVSDAAGARCEHMVNGLVHPAGDLSELQEHLRLLGEDRDLLSRLRSNSLMGIDKLSWSYAGKRLSAIYEDRLP